MTDVQQKARIGVIAVVAGVFLLATFVAPGYLTSNV